MNNDQNWYRQLLALVLLSGARAAVEYITNPSSKDEAGAQLRNAFQSIDYDSVADALTRAIENAAESSKSSLSDTIDSLRDRGVEAVDTAKSAAEEKLAPPKRRGRKVRFFFGLLVGAVLAYYFFDEQRRDDLLDRLTGASGPIETTIQQNAAPITQAAQQATQQATANIQSNNTGSSTGKDSTSGGGATSSTPSKPASEA